MLLAITLYLYRLRLSLFFVHFFILLIYSKEYEGTGIFLGDRSLQICVSFLKLPTSPPAKACIITQKFINIFIQISTHSSIVPYYLKFVKCYLMMESPL